ncbi:hypothetical protein HKX48_002210 [Thoreauomyces humboldtii]|nr:hypothetical protein HKX48_002210 [Thoreauomyces humboldtii]
MPSASVQTISTISFADTPAPAAEGERPSSVSIRSEKIRVPPPSGACVPRPAPVPAHVLGQQHENSDLFLREQELREAFDAYATLFGGLVEDHALLSKAPGASMMKVYVDNTNLLRTMADALVTPRLPVSRHPEIWSLRGCRGRLIDPIELSSLEAPDVVDEEDVERGRQRLPERVSDLVRNSSRRGTPTFENFRWGIVVAVGWLHVQNVEGTDGDILPAGNWINKYKKKLGFSAEDVSGHCAAIGAHTNGFTTPVGGHVFCYEASRHWLEKEGSLRRFHFILPLCPAHNRNTHVMKIKPNFPMLMVNTFESAKDQGDWTRSNGTLGATVNLQGKAGRSTSYDQTPERDRSSKSLAPRPSARPSLVRHTSNLSGTSSEKPSEWKFVNPGSVALLPDRLSATSPLDERHGSSVTASAPLRPLPERHESASSSGSVDSVVRSPIPGKGVADRPGASRHPSNTSSGSNASESVVPRAVSKSPKSLEQRIRAVFERKDHVSEEQ